MASEKKTGRFVQVVSANGPFEVVTREIAEPGRGHVRIRVQACGVCHSDSLTKYGLFPGIQYPRVPGHEVVGLVDAIGEDVTQWKVGQRVGLGWYGGHCTRCEPCRRGDLVCCQNLKIPGISYDGGYADYLTAPEVALAAIPESLGSAEAGGRQGKGQRQGVTEEVRGSTADHCLSFSMWRMMSISACCVLSTSLAKSKS